MQHDIKDELYHNDVADLNDQQHTKRYDVVDDEKLQVSKFDKLSVWKAAWLYRKIGMFCFLAAFSASLDGYQGSSICKERS